MWNNTFSLWFEIILFYWIKINSVNSVWLVILIVQRTYRNGKFWWFFSKSSKYKKPCFKVNATVCICFEDLNTGNIWPCYPTMVWAEKVGKFLSPFYPTKKKKKTICSCEYSSSISFYYWKVIKKYPTKQLWKRRKIFYVIYFWKIAIE